jgi:hypothetical protein
MKNNIINSSSELTELYHKVQTTTDIEQASISRARRRILKFVDTTTRN